MNDFTKEELLAIQLGLLDWHSNGGFMCEKENGKLMNKLQSMIDNYCEDTYRSRRIARSHLKEAESLISHAMCLLGMEDD